MEAHELQPDIRTSCDHHDACSDERPSTAADAASDMEVQALFDDIEYQKGGSVLRMLWNYMSSSHYASSRLHANVPLGHDVYVCASRPPMSCHCIRDASCAFLPEGSLGMGLLQEQTVCHA